MKKGVHIGGVRVDPTDYDEVMDRVREWVARRSTRVPYIVQINALSIVTANEHEEYRGVLQRADLNVPDGMPLVWLLRRRGFRLGSRVYGPDLMRRMCEEGSDRRWRCFLYGSTTGVLLKLQDVLRSEYPGLEVVGSHAPPFGEFPMAEERGVLERISEANPDILWVALGGPKQDMWMARHSGLVRAGLMHGVGAAFDFLSGNKRQAPLWMRNAGMEWLFRLVMEPKRLFKRYTVANLKFLYYCLVR